MSALVLFEEKQVSRSWNKEVNMDFFSIELKELEHNSVFNSIMNVAEDIAYKFGVEIKDINLEKTIYDEDEEWIDINLVINTDDSSLLAQMNLKLSEVLAGNDEYLKSKIDLVPFFLAPYQSQSKSLDLNSSY